MSVSCCYSVGLDVVGVNVDVAIYDLKPYARLFLALSQYEHDNYCSVLVVD